MGSPGPRRERPRAEGIDVSEDDSVCGETYDHDLDTDGPIDGLTIYVCRVCGAEIFEDNE